MSLTLSTLVIAVFSLPVKPVPLQGPFLASVALEQQAQGEPLGTRTSSGVSSMRCQYEHELSGNGGARLKLRRVCEACCQEDGEDGRKSEGPL